VSFDTEALKCDTVTVHKSKPVGARLAYGLCYTSALSVTQQCHFSCSCRLWCCLSVIFNKPFARLYWLLY